MKIPTLLTSFLISISSLSGAIDYKLSITLATDQVTIGYISESGAYHELWASSDLINDEWNDLVDSQYGDGSQKTVTLSKGSYDSRFFRLVTLETVAPSSSEFAALVVGKAIEDTDYIFTSSTRFSWFGETGNWSYVRTGANTATLTFTYDEDANNPNIYREEALLTFTTASTGTYNYGEYNSNVLDGSSVVSGAPFSLIGTVAPSSSEFAALVVGKAIEDTDYIFTSSTRFSWFGEAGNWSYVRTGANTATLTFTYDEDANNPNTYREEALLTFTTASTGTYNYGEYNSNVLDGSSVVSGAPFSLIGTVAPSSSEFAALVVGGYLANTDYFITSANRFSWFGENGNWSYVRTGANTATLTYTYDEDANNPNIYREEALLTFTTASTGTYNYGEYNSNVLDGSSVVSGLAFSL
jgi:predicted DCC family thiol-disulfide oxidoreductase YuxK